MKFSSSQKLRNSNFEANEVELELMWALARRPGLNLWIIINERKGLLSLKARELFSEPLILDIRYYGYLNNSQCLRVDMLESLT